MTSSSQPKQLTSTQTQHPFSSMTFTSQRKQPTSTLTQHTVTSTTKQHASTSVQPDNSFQIFVTNLDNSTRVIDATSRTTVGSILTQILPFTTSVAVLRFGSKLLNPIHTLSDYAIGRESTLQVLIPLKGGSKPWIITYKKYDPSKRITLHPIIYSSKPKRNNQNNNYGGYAESYNTCTSTSSGVTIIAPNSSGGLDSWGEIPNYSW